MVVALSVSTSLARPIAVILPFSATIVSASRIGFSRAPESNSPILRITSLPWPVAWGASWAMDRFPSFLETGTQFEPGLSAQSSRNIHLYANDFSPSPLLLGILAGLLDCGQRCAIVRAMRIALIHALKHSLVPIEDAFTELWPEVTRMNLLDDSLSADLARDERLTPAMTDRFLLLGRYAAATGADAILFTCSAFGPCIEAVAREQAPLPVLKPSDAMIEQAVALGRQIGLLATFAPTLASMPQEFPASVKIVPKL